jgi:hypothetical protein
MSALARYILLVLMVIHVVGAVVLCNLIFGQLEPSFSDVGTGFAAGMGSLAVPLMLAWDKRRQLKAEAEAHAAKTLDDRIPPAPS